MIFCTAFSTLKPWSRLGCRKHAAVVLMMRGLVAASNNIIRIPRPARGDVDQSEPAGAQRLRVSPELRLGSLKPLAGTLTIRRQTICGLDSAVLAEAPP